MKRKVMFFVAVVMCISLLLAGCTQSAAPSASATTSSSTSSSVSQSAGTSTPAETSSAPVETKKLKIGVSFDSLVSPWWVTNLNVMKEEAAKIGAELITVMAEGDAAKQNQQIENLIGQGVDAIICGPKDSAAIVTSIKKCKEAKIPIIMDNRSVSGDVLPDVQVVSNNQGMATKVLQAFADIAKKDGKKYNAILLIGGLSDENAVFRKKGHDEAIKNNPDIFNVVAEVPTDWNLDTCLKGLQNALQAHPEANLIITPSDYLWPPIRSSLEQIGRWAKIGDPKHFPVVAFDGDEVGMQYLKDGYSWGDAAQDAVLQGKLCIEWAVKLVNGEKPPQNIIYDEGQIITVENFKEVAPQVWSYSMLK